MVAAQDVDVVLCIDVHSHRVFVICEVYGGCGDVDVVDVMLKCIVWHRKWGGVVITLMFCER